MEDEDVPPAKKGRLIIDLTNEDECTKPRTREEYNSLNLETLRKLCTLKGVKVPKATNKDDRVQKLVEFDATRKVIAEVGGKPDPIVAVHTPIVKKKHCVFRLLNVLFSERFCEEFSNVGNSATREQLDSNAGKRAFWKKVETEFWNNTDDYGVILQVRDIYKDINPNQIQRHPADKLESMWKDVNAKYQKALLNYTKSGTHESEFWKFCSNCIETMYLRDLLQIRPNLNEFVQGGMKDDDKFDSLCDSPMNLFNRKSSAKKSNKDDPILKAIKSLKSPAKDKALIQSETELNNLNAEKIKGELKMFKLKEIVENDKMLKDADKSLTEARKRLRELYDIEADQDEIDEKLKDIAYYKKVKEDLRSNISK